MSRSPAQESLFRAWLQAHGGILAKVTRSFARTPADAADLRQEILLQLWISAPAFSRQARESTWVYRVCLNTALSWARSGSRRGRRIEPAVDPAALATLESTPADAAGDRELLEKLYDAIRSMEALERSLVLLSLDGLPYREIADITGLTENHVGVALTRARKSLARQLKGVADELE
ncbi:MAG TPA: RNA polymerase sigma factor [Opitutaceae bacterium]